jgi:hypothetical protein
MNLTRIYLSYGLPLSVHNFEHVSYTTKFLLWCVFTKRAFAQPLFHYLLCVHRHRT